MKLQRRTGIKTVVLEIIPRIVEYTWMIRRCHENALKYLKTGPHCRTFRIVKPNEFNMPTQSGEDSESIKKNYTLR